MKKLLIFLLLSTIGFSQDCENSILDEISLNENINMYFSLAVDIKGEQLNFLDDCNTDINYTLFTPDVNVPNSSITPLIGGTTPIIDLLLHYIYPNEILFSSVENINDYEEEYIMMDNNPINITGTPNGLVIDDNAYILNQLSPICTCNGFIYIINDLVWPPNINLDENSNELFIYPNPTKNVLNVLKNTEDGKLQLLDLNGKVLLTKEINKATQINTEKYKPGTYFIKFQSEKEVLIEPIIIN